MNSMKSVQLALVLFCCQPLVGQDLYFPPPHGEWATRKPSQVGMSPERVGIAVDFALDNEYDGDRDLRVAILKAFANEPFHEIVGLTKERGGPAGMILKDGYLVAQWGDLRRVDMTFSVTKSYLSTTFGLALDAGLINDVDDVVSRYVWDHTFQGEHNAKITWHHLLTQSSDWYGSLFGMPDWADRPPAQGHIDDWKQRELLEPGSNFEYNDVRVNLLAYALLQVWRRPLPAVLKEQVMDRIGASSTWRWYGYSSSWIEMDGLRIQSVSGGGHSGGGLFISTEDQARFGLLFLANGNWNGDQILSEDWIRRVQRPSEANPGYGYMWWLNNGDQKWQNVDQLMYYAAGFGGNYIVVVPAHNLVLITRWLEPSHLERMVELVLESVQ